MRDQVSALLSLGPTTAKIPVNRSRYNPSRLHYYDIYLFILVFVCVGLSTLFSDDGVIVWYTINVNIVVPATVIAVVVVFTFIFRSLIINRTPPPRSLSYNNVHYHKNVCCSVGRKWRRWRCKAHSLGTSVGDSHGACKSLQRPTSDTR